MQKLKNKSYNLGIATESKAAGIYKNMSYQILANRYKCAYVGEVDIIAEKDNTLAFIEVKARKQQNGAYPVIQKKQQERIRNTAEYFLGDNPKYQNYNVRFDLAIMDLSKAESFEIIHNAF